MLTPYHTTTSMQLLTWEANAELHPSLLELEVFSNAYMCTGTDLTCTDTGYVQQPHIIEFVQDYGHYNLCCGGVENWKYKAEIEPPSLAFQHSALTITPPRFPDISLPPTHGYLPMRPWEASANYYNMLLVTFCDSQCPYMSIKLFACARS